MKDTPTQNLVDNGQGAGCVAAWYRGGWGGGWGGSYRGFGWGGGWGGYGLGGLGWGGYRGLWLGRLRPGRFGLGRRMGWLPRLWLGRLWPGLGGFGLGGYGLGLGGYGLGLGGFYPGFGLGYGGFWPCAGASAGVFTLNGAGPIAGHPMAGAPQPGNVVPAPRQQPGNDGTFPYDGGPAKPVPSINDTPPSSDHAALRSARGPSVSLPKPARSGAILLTVKSLDEPLPLRNAPI